MVTVCSVIAALGASDSPNSAPMPPHWAIVEPVGRMVMTEQALMVSIDLSVLQQFGDRLQAAMNSVYELETEVDKMASDHTNKKLFYVSMLRVVLVDTKALLTDLVVGHKVHYGTQSSDQIGKAGRRKKRWALFPVIGSVFKGLFGVATSADLDEYVDHIKVLTKVAKQHGQLIEHALQAINEQADIIEDIEGRVKLINDQLLSWSFEIKSMARGGIMFAHAQVLYNQVEVLAGKYHDLLRDIVLASRGMVSPTLLSPLKLREALAKLRISGSLNHLWHWK